MNCECCESKKNHIPLTKNEKITALLGTIIYIIVFIITIPIILYKFGFTTLMKIYIINTDLIATAISFKDGPFKNIFKYLYNNSNPFIGYMSQNIINLSVLLGIFYIRLSESKTENFYVSLSKLTLILSITYLFPGRFILDSQNKFYNYIGEQQFWNGYEINGIKTVLLGLFITLLLITIEDLSIRYFSNNLAQFFNSMHKLIK